MGLLQEGLRRSGEIRNSLAPVNLNPSELKINTLPIGEASLTVRIGEISRMLSAEGQKGKEADEQPQKETRTDGFEPFVNPEPTENPLFVNGYVGNFAQVMELNRVGIERVLKIAHLDGKVVLVNVSSLRFDAEAQGNELAAKRTPSFGEKIEEDHEENPFLKVVPTPQGWRIEINDARITEELTEKKLSGKKLQKEFIKRFDGHLKEALKECIWREKLSSEKDKYFRLKRFNSLWFASTLIITSVLINPNDLLFNTSFYFISNAIVNLLTNLKIPDKVRKIDALWEYFMPFVEVDKVARSAAFLVVKGRTLVKEVS